MKVAQRIVKRINNLSIRKTQMATIHAIDGNTVDIIIGKTSVAVRGVEVIGGTDTLKIGDELPVSWIDGRPVIFSGTNEQVIDIDIDGIVESVLSQVSYEANSNGVSLDLFNSHRGNASAHHAPVTTIDSETVIFTLVGQNISASVNPTALNFVTPDRQIIAGSGLTGGGALATDVTLNVGAGVGISVGADTVEIDLAANLTWTGSHIFSTDLTLGGDLLPSVSGVSDIGSATKFFKTIYLSGEYELLQKEYPEWQPDTYKINYLKTDNDFRISGLFVDNGDGTFYDYNTIVIGKNSLSALLNEVQEAVAIGNNILASSIGGTYFVAIGHNALSNGNYPDGDVAIGHSAMENSAVGANVAIGDGAMRDNTGSSAVGIGFFALGNNQGSCPTAIGANAGYMNTGNYAAGVGRYSVWKNTGDFVSALGAYAASTNQGNYTTAVGYYSGERNTQDFVSAFGSFSGFENVSIGLSSLGYRSGSYNHGLYAVGLGQYSIQFNFGDYSIGVGYNAAKSNLGNNIIAIGTGALKANTKNNNIAIGHNANGSYQLNHAAAKLFNSINIEWWNGLYYRIYIANHGFGAPGDIVNLHFTQGTGGLPGLGLDNDNVYAFEVLDSNYIRLFFGPRDMEWWEPGDGHKLTPLLPMPENTIVIGNDVDPTISNQIVIGNDTHVETRLNGNVVVQNHFLPYTSGVSDIGSATNLFRTLHLAGEVIDIKDGEQLKRVFIRDDIGDFIYARYYIDHISEGFTRSIIIGHNSLSAPGLEAVVGSVIIGDNVLNNGWVDGTVVIGNDAAKQGIACGYAVIIGHEAAKDVTADLGNSVIVGAQALSNGTGVGNTVVGSQAGYSSSFSWSVFAGTMAGFMSSGENNIGIGVNSLGNNTGSNSIGIGRSSLDKNTQSGSIGIGHRAGFNNSGSGLVSIGYQSAQENKGVHSVGIGYESIRLNSGDYSVFIGNNSGRANSGHNSIGIGYGALRNNFSDNNIAIGKNSEPVFTIQAGTEKTFNGSNISYYSNYYRIYIPAHGFGLTGETVSLLYSEGSDSLSHIGFEDNNIYKFYIIDANYIKIFVMYETSGLSFPGTGHSLTKIDAMPSNTIAIGNDVHPVASNQIMIGGSSFTSTIFYPNVGIGVTNPTAALDVDGNIVVRGHLLPHLTDTSDIGSATMMFRKGWLSELESVVFSENTISVIGGWLMVAKGQGSFVADILSTDTQIDFGQTMTPDDFVIIRSSVLELSVPKTEYMQVGTLVSGTTYNVTRGVGGISAKDWVAGTVYVVLGNTGDGRIEIQGGDTPRFSLLTQGAAYNAQTEYIRIGDLNGMPGFSTETYGIFIGDATNYLKYANGTLTIAGLDGSSITNINGGNITTGYISADRIEAGTITATHIGTNTIVASSANIADAVITNAKIDSLDASKITTGYLNADRIEAGTISAAKLSATAIDGMTITGALIQTSASNPRVFMNGDGLFATNVSGVGILGISTINAKSWAGHTLDQGDLVIGNVTTYVKWDASAGSLSIAGNGSGITNISGGNITAGTITATQIGTNEIIANTANIKDAVITNAKITSLDASKITSGYISADRIEAGTIVGTKLSADAIDGKTITGAIIRTAASGARTELNHTNLFGLGFGGIGGTDGTTAQWYAKTTDGKLYAGGGLTIIDKDGISLVPQVVSTPGSSIKWGSKFQIGMYIDEKSTFANIDVVDEVAILTSSATSSGGTTPGATNKMVAMASANQIGFKLVATNTDKYAAVYGGRLEVETGSAASPSLTFYNDTNTGLYNTADHVWITTGGTNRVAVNSSAVYMYQDARIGGGLYVGSTSVDPGAGSIVATGTLTVGGNITINSGDIIGNYGAVSFVVGDGVNVIANGSLVRVSVPFDMEISRYHISAANTPASAAITLQYYNGTSWVSLINQTGISSTSINGTLSSGTLQKNTSSAHRLLLYTVTANGGAKQLTLTVQYKKLGAAT